MAKKCPTGFVCTDWSTVGLVGFIVVIAVGFLFYMNAGLRVEPTRVVRQESGPGPESGTGPEPRVIVVQQQQDTRPGLYSEPTQRYLPTLSSRGPPAPYQQIGVMSAEGGSSSSAAPDRTILPLYGRELDTRRGRWNYFTRTDGANPVQVPVRYRNRVCDDDINGCDEIYSDESVHVPVLGRAFKATVYSKSIF